MPYEGGGGEIVINRHHGAACDLFLRDFFYYGNMQEEPDPAHRRSPATRKGREESLSRLLGAAKGGSLAALYSFLQAAETRPCLCASLCA